MTILITGSTGKSSPALIKVLETQHPSVELVVASRSGKDIDGHKGAKFDWTDASTVSAGPRELSPRSECMECTV